MSRHFRSGGKRAQRRRIRWAQSFSLFAGCCLASAAVAVPFLGAAPAYASGPDPQGTIYVADYGTNSVDVFAPGTNGNVAPERVISGPDTGINGPGDVKVDANGDVYVSNFSGASITEYAPGASGDASPICTISGPNTELYENDDMSLEADGTLVVGDIFDAAGDPGEVLVFPPGSCGDVTPAETIVGSNTGFNYVDGVGTDAAGTIHADSSVNGAIEAFPAGANGNVAPESSITGPDTGLGYPDDIIVGFDGEIYATSGYGGPVNAVTVYAPGASGDAKPLQDITGSNTDFGLPDDMAVDTSGNIYVTDSEATVGPAVLVFASGATGNVAPTAIIAGSATTFSEPEGVAVAGPPSTQSASMSTSVSDPTISLGQSTSDTATLSDGTFSPTGSIVFKLFGPNDPTCSKAPAYVSPAQTVTGDGNYHSPSFTPTQAGSYSWQDLYSGDSHNAPITSACNDPHEQVTVSSSVQRATLKVCKVAGPGVMVGTAVGFTVGSRHITVKAGPAPGGYCVIVPGKFVVGDQVTITEQIPNTMAVTAITSAPPGRVVSKNVPKGTVTDTLGSGVTEVTFTDKVVKGTGYVEICNSAAAGVTGSYSFIYDGKTVTIPVGFCSSALKVHAGALTIKETLKANSTFSTCHASPPSRLLQCYQSTRTAVVAIVPGNVSTETVAKFVNT